VADWIENAAKELLSLRGTAPGWSFRSGAEPFSEPSALAILGLAGAGRARAADLAATGKWLAGIQQADGSVGLAESIPEPTWPTALAILAWGSLGGFAAERSKAAGYLLGFAGAHWQKPPDDPVGHDTSIKGWPWAAGTHSWLEPTALALLALKREGHGSHERVREGTRLILDRALPGGGWNYGNTTVLGRELRPVPGPTGLALLALSGQTPRTGALERALVYLSVELPRIRAPESLCWALLGFAAWTARPGAAAGWLAEAHARMRPDGVRALQLSHLLLAGGKDALPALGLA